MEETTNKCTKIFFESIDTMVKNVFLLIGFLCVLTGCIKSVNNPTANPVVQAKVTTPTITIQATGGTGQIDSAGKALADSIVVKINEPGSSLNKFFVQILQNTLCNDDSTSERSILNNSKIAVKWRLSNKIGTQTLKFTVLDSTRKIIDSIKVTATVLPPSPGWHKASCIVPTNVAAACFAKLGTGRIIAGEPGNWYTQYSDDNGLTWHGLKTFYFGYYAWPIKAAVSTTNEVYFSTVLNGIFYSDDNGTTWKARSSGIPPLTANLHVFYLPNGKLISTTQGGGLYISTDKGISWATISPDAQINSQHEYVGTATNGDIYVTETNNNGTAIKKLDSVTLKLSSVGNLPAIRINAFFIDPTGAQYVGGYNSVTKTSEIYRLINNGTTWANVFSLAAPSSNNTIYNISRQGDNNYYFVLGSDGPSTYYKTADFISYKKMSTTLYSGVEYVVAANGYFLVNYGASNVMYYVP